ncbi:MAG: TVP38/TMEM64 family protein [Anaerolineae bacterium]|nr:TVP38/TMEM64 family protein [Anaerolineae bacterium]
MKFYNIDLRVWLPRAAAVGACIAGYILLVRFGWLPLDPFAPLFAFGETIRAELPKYGALAPLVYILLYAGQIVIAPLPGAALAYTAGYLFGPIAALYSMIGIITGAALGFVLARRLGWPLIEKLTPQSWIERWRNLSAVNSSFTWFLLMLAPTADIFYFIAGLTTLSFRRFMFIVLVGRLPGIVLASFLGANLESFGFQWIFVLIAAMLLVSLFGNWVRQRVEKRALLAAQAMENKSA